MGMMLLGSLLTCALGVQAEQWAPTEADHYTIRTYEPPAGVELEVSGLAVLPDGRPLVCTRRGELWVLDDPEAEDGGLRLLMQGLQEPLGLLLHKGWIYVSQRGELSRLRDVDGDDVIDELETVCDAWRISGNYHEYLFGPRLDHEGNLWLTANKPFGGEPFGRVDWRGFALRVTPEGEMLPTCAALRQFTAEVRAFATADAPHRDALLDAVQRLENTTDWLLLQAKGNPNEVGAASVEFLHLFGYVAYAWLWSRMAQVAANMRSEDAAFYDAKLATAGFYFRRLLPRILSLEAAIRAGSEPLFGLGAEQF